MSNRWRKFLLNAGHIALKWAWPGVCSLCGEAADEAPLCRACEQDLPRLPAQRCPVCALPAAGGERCGRCLRRAPHFDATLALFVYADAVRDLVMQVKLGHDFPVAAWLSAQLAIAAQDIREVDAVLPVPLHPQRLLERGFNPALELARGMAKNGRLPLWRAQVLRDVDTPHQAGLRLRERQRSVRGAFRSVSRIDGAHVVVVDDVMTSGSTLNELARSLKLAGAARVSNLVVARTLAQPAKNRAL